MSPNNSSSLEYWLLENSGVPLLFTNLEGNIINANDSGVDLLTLPRKTQENIFNWVPEHFHSEPEFTLEHLSEHQDYTYILRRSSQEGGQPQLDLKVHAHMNHELKRIVLRVSDLKQAASSSLNQWTFESFIAHKLKTPITKADWNLHLLVDKYDKLNPSQIQQFIHNSYEATTELKRSVQSILRYLQIVENIDKKGQTHTLELTDLIESLQRQTGIKPVLFHWQNQSDDAILQISRRLLEIVFREIIANAIKFHPDRDPQLEVFLNVNEQRLFTISFRNDGEPIIESSSQWLWHPYYQGESSYTGQVAGTGIGLSMIASILEELKGKYYIRNLSDQKGVEVTIAIPYTQAL